MCGEENKFPSFPLGILCFHPFSFTFCHFYILSLQSVILRNNERPILVISVPVSGSIIYGDFI